MSSEVELILGCQGSSLSEAGTQSPRAEGGQAPSPAGTFPCYLAIIRWSHWQLACLSPHPMPRCTRADCTLSPPMLSEYLGVHCQTRRVAEGSEGGRLGVGELISRNGERHSKLGDKPQQKPGGVSFFDIFGAIPLNYGNNR